MRDRWKNIEIEKVAQIGAGNSAPQDEGLFENGIFPFFRTSDIGKIKIGGIKSAQDYLNEDGIRKLKLHPKGTILIPKSGASTFLNHRVILEVEGYISSHLATIYADSDYLDERFALYFLMGIQSQDLIQDHAYPSLKLSDIKRIKIPLPILSEQKQIVEILDDAFIAIAQAKANIEKNIQNTKELFDSKKEVLFEKLALEYKPSAITEACLKIFAGGDAPKDNYSKEKTEEFNIPIIANAVKNNGLYGYTNVARVTKPSITIAARGSGTGHTEFRDYHFLPIVRLIVLIPDPTSVEVEFLMYAIKNLTILRSGSAIPQLTVPMIKRYSIPIPNLDTQIQIVTILNDLECKLQSYTSKLENKLSDLEDLKKSILQKAFAGELTNKTVEV